MASMPRVSSIRRWPRSRYRPSRFNWSPTALALSRSTPTGGSPLAHRLDAVASTRRAGRRAGARRSGRASRPAPAGASPGRRRRSRTLTITTSAPASQWRHHCGERLPPTPAAVAASTRACPGPASSAAAPARYGLSWRRLCNCRAHHAREASALRAGQHRQQCGRDRGMPAIARKNAAGVLKDSFVNASGKRAGRWPHRRAPREPPRQVPCQVD